MIVYCFWCNKKLQIVYAEKIEDTMKENKWFFDQRSSVSFCPEHYEAYRGLSDTKKNTDNRKE